MVSRLRTPRIDARDCSKIYGRVFYGITNSLVLTPALAAHGWIVSDSLVFGNSLLVRRFYLSNRINSNKRKITQGE
ncbi:MAG TPA: hypothetical protein VE264_01475 [Nitrososphaera sp.]|nr:hypothetical protein [Nitrososphaera sp.]